MSNENRRLTRVKRLRTTIITSIKKHQFPFGMVVFGFGFCYQIFLWGGKIGWSGDWEFLACPLFTASIIAIIAGCDLIWQSESNPEEDLHHKNMPWTHRHWLAKSFSLVTFGVGILVFMDQWHMIIAKQYGSLILPSYVLCACLITAGFILLCLQAKEPNKKIWIRSNS
jgi:hypothetical protein